MLFQRARDRGFDVSFTYHAEAILKVDFPEAESELDEIVSAIRIPIAELVGGGGGEALGTQRLRRLLAAIGWNKVRFRIEKRINEAATQSRSHEIDHVKRFAAGTIALEVEWNNKDPFFDRDLESFHRLHADGGIRFGVIVTRGRSFQDGIEERLRRFVLDRNIDSFAALEAHGVDPTRRQRTAVERGGAFADVWPRRFVADKFGAATTHWAKLEDRLARGVGSPCPIVALGIPLAGVAD